jgi:hypothetical protein
MESASWAIGFFDVWAGLARTARLLFPVARVDRDTESGHAWAFLGFDCVPIELGFVSQHTHRCVHVAPISVADAALQLQVHVFAPSGIFLAENLGIDRGLPVHRLVISFEDRTFADAVVGRELDALGKRRQRPGNTADQNGLKPCGGRPFGAV